MLLLSVFMKVLTKVGIVGGGQLAMMMIEAAHRLEMEVVVLADASHDPIPHIASNVIEGDARNLADLKKLASMTEVITFDHELIDSMVLAALEDEGVTLRPGSSVLEVTTNKVRQSQLFDALGLPNPETKIVDNVGSAIEGVEAFDGAAILKTATGGYDGRGVLFDVSPDSIAKWFPTDSVEVLVQRKVHIDHEIAVQVVRGADGTSRTYPVVRTTQENGICSMVQVPSGLGPELEADAASIARTIADAIGSIGILTVEMFVVKGVLIMNELAARPHNSGHLTIESARTSQFENHLRAVTGQPLGGTDLVVPAAAMANAIGIEGKGSGSGILPADGAIHLYGKVTRPGRKLGHVTCIAATAEEAVVRAQHAARAIEAARFGS